MREFVLPESRLVLPEVGPEEVVVAEYGRRAFRQTIGGKKFFLVGAGKDAESFRPPSIIMPVTTDRMVVVVRQFRAAALQLMIELPGGNPKTAADKPAEVAIAELVEETGFVPERVVNLGGNYWFDPASWRAHCSAFLALDCEKKQEASPDESEDLEQIEIPLNDWLAMIQRGEIKDAKTVMVTFLALPHLGLSIS